MQAPTLFCFTRKKRSNPSNNVNIGRPRPTITSRPWVNFHLPVSVNGGLVAISCLERLLKYKKGCVHLVVVLENRILEQP